MASRSCVNSARTASHGRPDHQRARRSRRSGARPRAGGMTSGQAVFLRRTAGARRGARPTQRHHCQRDHLAGRRSRDRPRGANAPAGAARAFCFFPREFQLLEYLVRNEGQRRIQGDVAAACLGSSFRSFDQYYRRLCRACAPQGRRPAGLSADPYGARCRVLSPCSSLRPCASSTFKLALIAIGTFGVIVSIIFSYVYLSTSSYVRGRSDRAIMTEYLSLQGAYQRSGRDGLIAADSSNASPTRVLRATSTCSPILH